MAVAVAVAVAVATVGVRGAQMQVQEMVGLRTRVGVSTGLRAQEQACG